MLMSSAQTDPKPQPWERTVPTHARQIQEVATLALHGYVVSNALTPPGTLWGTGTLARLPPALTHQQGGTDTEPAEELLRPARLFSTPWPRQDAWHPEPRQGGGQLGMQSSSWSPPPVYTASGSTGSHGSLEVLRSTWGFFTRPVFTQTQTHDNQVPPPRWGPHGS